MKVAESRRAYRQANKEKVAESRRAYYQANKEKLEHEMRETVRTDSTKLRSCLRCDREFMSQGPHNRICPRCKGQYQPTVKTKFWGTE